MTSLKAVGRSSVPHLRTQCFMLVVASLVAAAVAATERDHVVVARPTVVMAVRVWVIRPDGKEK